MGYIDLHCDTLTALRPGETFAENSQHIRVKDLRKACVLVQCCAMFVPCGILGKGLNGETLSPQRRREKIIQECSRIYSVYQREMAANREELHPIMKHSDVGVCEKNKKSGILLTIEDGGALLGDIKRLEMFCQKGVRLVTLTWNHENELGYPASQNREKMAYGLKDFGREAVWRMSELGIIADVSHLSDGGFFETADIMYRLGKPFVASHSNARSIAKHQRNLSDSMLRRLAECGGVAGLNFAPQFLNDRQPKDGESCISDMVRHVLHMRNVGGCELLAVGSDFDGMQGSLEIAGPSQMERLWEALRLAGLHESELEKMKYKNALRVIRDIIG